MLKKLIALGLSLSLIASLVGCNSKNKNTEASLEGTEVTFWNSFTGADGDMLVKMVINLTKKTKME